LRVHACDELQEFYFNKPLSAQQFTELLQAPTSDGRRAAPTMLLA
jgi:EAL domain-containing protein (putative c-di-GMP-specific phosphodiesterase class I)